MRPILGDIIVSRAANNTATDFIRTKICSIVHDPAVAEKLCPNDLYAKRPLAVDGYYETYNRDIVPLADVKATPIVAITQSAIPTTAEDIDLDVLIFATGFDAVTGNYLKIVALGRNGRRLQDEWRDDPHWPHEHEQCCGNSERGSFYSLQLSTVSRLPNNPLQTERSNP